MAKVEVDIHYVAELARLRLDDEQAPRLQKDLESIVGYIAKLGELDVSGVEPTAHAAALANVWREDVRRESFPREAMLANAPERVDENLLAVPQVLRMTALKTIRSALYPERAEMTMILCLP